MRCFRIEADVTGSEATADRKRRQEQGCMFQAKTEAAYSASADMVMPFVSFLRDGHIVCGMLTKAPVTSRRVRRHFWTSWGFPLKM